VKGFSAILFLLLSCRLFADEVIPPSPTAYFNDYAHVVSTNTASQLNQTLENFERQTSEQIVVAVFPKMQSDSSVEDYTVRVARSWKVGQKGKNNGAVLFVFIQDHRMFIQVGYGLESVLPDALCKRIIDEQIVPRFKAGDYDAGLTAGVQSLLAATKGEYQGNGQTVADAVDHRPSADNSVLNSYLFLPGIIFILIIIVMTRRLAFGPWWLISLILSNLANSRNDRDDDGFFGGGGSSGGGSSGGGGGFSGGGGGGGFSGGGGSFGGGGAGGSW